MPPIAAVEPSLLASQIYSGHYFKPGAKQSTTALRLATYSIADENTVQTHLLAKINASSALRLSRSDKMNITNPGMLLQLLKTVNTC